MKKVCLSLLVLCFLSVLSGLAFAAEDTSDNDIISTVGVILSMDDGFFLDDGAQIYLLVGMDDPQYTDSTVEVLGELTLVYGAPAINVKEITIINDSSQENESENNTNSTSITN
jgi:hypothetical protein